MHDLRPRHQAGPDSSPDHLRRVRPRFLLRQIRCRARDRTDGLIQPAPSAFPMPGWTLPIVDFHRAGSARIAPGAYCGHGGGTHSDPGPRRRQRRGPPPARDLASCHVHRCFQSLVRIYMHGLDAGGSEGGVQAGGASGGCSARARGCHDHHDRSTEPAGAASAAGSSPASRPGSGSADAISSIARLDTGRPHMSISTVHEPCDFEWGVRPASPRQETPGRR